MRRIEISGNLEDERYLNYELFYSTINKVLDLYFKVFEKELENPIDLLIDNATRGSGETPIITPILRKYLIIKLNIGENDTQSRIIYQFSHEFTHYMFYIKYGLDKPKADCREESICSAASLIALKELCPCELEKYCEHVKNLNIDMYRYGFDIAEEAEYSFENLKKLI